MIYNIKDDILILLRQFPAADAAQQGSLPPKLPMLQSGQTSIAGDFAPFSSTSASYFKNWGTDQLWYAIWMSQRNVAGPDAKAYDTMEPRLNVPSGSVSQSLKRRDLQYILVPDVGLARRSIGLAHACYYQAIFAVGQPQHADTSLRRVWVISRQDRGARMHFCRYHPTPMSPSY